MTSNIFTVLVCGGRDYRDRDRVLAELDKILNQTKACGVTMRVVTGGASGADSLAEEWASERPGFLFRVYEAQWHKYGLKAGPARNAQMLREETVNLVVAFPGGKGTADMVRRARAAAIEVREINEQLT